MMPQETMSQRIKLAPRASFAIAASGVVITVTLLFHFVLTVLYVTPLNPIKLRVQDPLMDYMLPFFDQNWSFFAPAPLTDERGLLVRARVQRADGSSYATDFYDITNPAINRVHNNRLFPPRHARLVSSALQLALWKPPLVDIDPRVRGRKLLAPKKAPLEKWTPEELSYRRRARRFLQALASAEAIKKWGPEVVAVQARLVIHVFPRFSQRSSDHVGEVTYHDFDWMAPVKVSV